MQKYKISKLSLSKYLKIKKSDLNKRFLRASVHIYLKSHIKSCYTRKRKKYKILYLDKAWNLIDQCHQKRKSNKSPARNIFFIKVPALPVSNQTDRIFVITLNAKKKGKKLQQGKEKRKRNASDKYWPCFRVLLNLLLSQRQRKRRIYSFKDSPAYRMRILSSNN